MNLARRVLSVADKRIDLSVAKARIRKRMSELQISGNEVSRRAGLGVSYVNDFLAGSSTRPSLSNLDLVAQALKCETAYLLGESDEIGPREGTLTAPGAGSLVTIPTGRRTAELGRVPLYGAPWPDAEGFFVMGDSPDELTPLPFEPVVGAYAVVVPDELMSPRYATGDKVFVNPRRPLAVGSYAVARLTDGRAIIRRIAALNASTVALEDLATGGRIELERDRIHTLHRITASCDA